MRPTPSPPSFETLLACGRRIASALALPEPQPESTRAFFDMILFRPQRQGGRELWPAFALGIITDSELRSAVLARFATWLSNEKDVREPSCDIWGSAQLEADVDAALFGRPATRG